VDLVRKPAMKFLFSLFCAFNRDYSDELTIISPYAKHGFTNKLESSSEITCGYLGMIKIINQKRLSDITNGKSSVTEIFSPKNDPVTTSPTLGIFLWGFDSV